MKNNIIMKIKFENEEENGHFNNIDKVDESNCDI